MFKKLVSQLSLSPSAASQLTFYARRLGQERITRTFTAIAGVLLIGLQASVVLIPPTPSNAASPNDLIHGGFVSQADLLNRYDESSELKGIYNRLGITRADLQNTKKATVSSKDQTLKSFGRSQHSSGDYEVEVNGRKYWMQPLHNADQGASRYNGSNYTVLEGKRSRDGSYFSVMYSCGNVITKNPPPAPTATPRPTPTPIPATPAPKPTPTPKPGTPTLACTSLTPTATVGDAPLKVNFTSAGSASGQSIATYMVDFGDNTPASATPDANASHTYRTPGTFTASLRLKSSTGKISDASAACSVKITVNAVAASYTKNKTALNLTQNIDATTKPAVAGDIIKYNLTTKNIGGVGGDYIVVEHVSDVLEYANLAETNGATLSEGTLTWPTASIKPGETLVKSFTVKIKNPIPDTPIGISDKNSYDLRLDNVYGSAVHISLTPPPAKQVEAAAVNLPATGAPLATLIVLVVSTISLFFYFRNRQLLAEIKLLRGEYQGRIQ